MPQVTVIHESPGVSYSSSSTTSAGAWLDWNTASTTTCTSTVSTWRVWNGPNQVAQGSQYVIHTPKPLTEEQKAENERKRKEYLRKQKTIQQRALKLLLQHLNRDQQKEYVRTKQFTITLPNGHRYLLQRVWSGNVYRLNDQNLATCRYCLHFATMIPYEDLLLAQKLLIEANEAEFIRSANVTLYSTPQPPYCLMPNRGNQ